MKLRIAVAAGLLSVSFLAGAQDILNQGFRWDRVLMDGSRSANPSLIKGDVLKVKKVVDAVQPQMAELKRVIAYSDAEMTKYGPESPLSNWCADLLLEQGEVILGSKVDVSVANFGGIRVDMPKGDVIVDDIRSMFPFKNDITFLKMRGSNLMELFQQMARTGWQVLGGVRIVATDSEVESVLIGGEPLDENKLYTVITNTFLLHGGDGLFLADLSEEVDIRKDDMYEAVMANIKANTAKGKHIFAQTDGRIQVKRAPRPEGASKERYDNMDYSYVKGAKAAAHKLNILHTNDTHSHIDAIRAGESSGMAGIVERAVFVDSVRRADKASNVLLVDAGDFEQGTPYFTLFRGKVEIETMNRMHYDAVTLGNHEFDNGIDDLAQRLRLAKFDVVLCNYEFDHAGLNKVLKPYTIIRRGGKKIGLIGVLTDVSTVVDGDIAKQLRYINPVEPVNKWAKYLKEEKKCDMVIVLSHLGTVAEHAGDVDGACDISLAALTHDVDIIIGGHTHSDVEAPIIINNADGKAVPVVTDYCWGIYVGEIKIN